MLPVNEGPLTVPSASSGELIPGILLAPAALLLLRTAGQRGRPGGSGRGLLASGNRRHRPVPAADPIRRQRRAGEPGAAARRSARASRMSRSRQGAAAGREVLAG
jgi:hypothetical protein